MSWVIVWLPHRGLEATEDAHGPFETHDEAEAHAETASIPLSWPYRLDERE